MKCLVALCLISASAAAQSPLLDSLLSTHSFVFELRDGVLRGPGADTILAEAAAAQFVALGEEHNRLEIPLFVTALFRALHERSGYQYFAEEQDPVTMRRISVAPVRGNRDSIVAISRRYQHAFTFMSDQELDMLAALGVISTAHAHPIWGCDQAFGAEPILDALLTLPLGGAARATVAALRDTAAVKERVRDLATYHFVSDTANTAAFAEIERAVHPPKSGEAEFLIQSLIVSNRIYRNYSIGRHYENGYEREEYMKSRFLDEYRRAESIDHRPPRVLMKFGHWHVFRGLGPSNLQTLGDFVSQFAIANGSRSYHIAVWPNNANTDYGGDSSVALLAAHAPRTGWTLVDLRALRPDYAKLTSDMSPAQRDYFRRWIFGFDAAVFIGGLQRGTWALNPGVEY